jgi:uncharacterized protein (TIGR02145 family)
LPAKAGRLSTFWNTDHFTKIKDAMKRKTILVSLLAIAGMIASAQEPAMELTFTAIDSAAWVKLDSIKVMNRTQGGDTVLVYPDTVLALGWVGLPESQASSVGLSVQIYPNPVTDHSAITVFIPGDDLVRITVVDRMGRLVIQRELQLSEGKHTFSLTPGRESLYLFATEWRGYTRTLKIINLSDKDNTQCLLSYEGFGMSDKQIKTIETMRGFDFSPGDTLLYIGYADTLQSGILDAPEASETFPFQFATDIPCLGTPTVTYEGQVYNTIQLFSQCWMKENLNVGAMTLGVNNMTDNGIIEKYCYNNEPDSCTKYGALYQWKEMMQYTYQLGAQGICPPGWHIPTDEEWKVQNAAADSQYGIGDPEWDIGTTSAFNGLDAGFNLKTTTGWALGYNGNNKFDFSWMPSGTRWSTSFNAIGEFAPIWSSTKVNNYDGAWYRILYYYSPYVGRFDDFFVYGFAVRCISDY